MPTSTPMQLGMVGLGRMGAGLVAPADARRTPLRGLRRHPAAVKALEDEGATGSNSMAEFVEKLTAPRAVWVMVPAGEITAKTITDLASHMSSGDTSLTGATPTTAMTFATPSALPKKGIHHIDCGTSGGVWGIDRGFCLMIGGEDETVQRLSPIFATIAPGVGTAAPTPRVARATRRRRTGLLALRPERRRPLREDGPQRDRVRADGVVRRGAEHLAQCQRGQAPARAGRRDGAARDP